MNLTLNLTLSLDEDVVAKAHKRAEEMGTSVDLLVQEYLERLAVTPDPEWVAEEFVRLSKMSKGNSDGWKWNREDAYEGRL
jgi:hypothetical protein